MAELFPSSVVKPGSLSLAWTKKVSPYPGLWIWSAGLGKTAVIQTVTSNSVKYHYIGANYRLRLPPGAGSCQQLSNGLIRLRPDASGKLVLILAER